MTLVDSDLCDDFVDNVTIDSPLKPTELSVDVDTNNNDDEGPTGDCPKDLDEDELRTPMSNVTATTSKDESLDYSPISNSESPTTANNTLTYETMGTLTILPTIDNSKAPIHNDVTATATATTTANDESLGYSTISYSESPDVNTSTITYEPNGTDTFSNSIDQSLPPPQLTLTSSDIHAVSAVSPALVAVGSDPVTSVDTNSRKGPKTLYSIRLPGVGKILAINSGHSCDVDSLYDQEKKACDVDAFVGKIGDDYEDFDDTDDDDDSDLPLYTSSANVNDNGMIHSGNSSVGGDDDDDFDLEANRSSIVSIIRRIDPPLDPQCDPFAQRIGKKLSWRNVNMSLKTKSGEKKLLHNVWGEVPSTETTAIMGASGAGKTSLLNILAGRARSRGNIRIEADVRLENYAVDPTSIKIRKSIAFVAQDDSLQITATPREAIRFSAKLRLPRSTTDSQLDLLTTRMINELGLTSCADTIVGGPLIKGLSGGERKRASVGVELVVKPAMVFLDEPTSGLDSFSAVQVCQVLKKVANSGASVLFTIHQPSSEIFDSFDRLILLHKGRVLFQGPVKDVPVKFASCGYPVPNNFNPADWVVNVAQKYPIPDLERVGFYQNDTREVSQPTLPLKGQNTLGEPIVQRFNTLLPVAGGNNRDDPPGLWAQVNLLYRRELTYMYRFPLPLYARFGFTAFLGFLIGIIFYKVGEASPADPFNITSQFGAMMILLMLAMLGTAQPALLFFPEERPIFLREYSTDHYSVMSYFFSRLLVEMMNTGIQILIMTTLIYFMVSFNGSVWIYFGATYALAMSGTAMAVMLGVLAEGNAKVAQQLLPLLFIPQLLFSGFFVSPSLMPKFLQWAQYVCVLTYAVRVLIVEEFHNCSENTVEQRNCENLVKNVRADPDQLLFYWSMLVVYFIVFRTLALFLLRKSATKFY